MSASGNFQTAGGESTREQTSPAPVAVDASRPGTAASRISRPVAPGQGCRESPERGRTRARRRKNRAPSPSRGASQVPRARSAPTEIPRRATNRVDVLQQIADAGPHLLDVDDRRDSTASRAVARREGRRRGWMAVHDQQPGRGSTALGARRRPGLHVQRPDGDPRGPSASPDRASTRITANWLVAPATIGAAASMSTPCDVKALPRHTAPSSSSPKLPMYRAAPSRASRRSPSAVAHLDRRATGRRAGGAASCSGWDIRRRPRRGRCCSARNPATSKVVCVAARNRERYSPLAKILLVEEWTG